MRVTYRGPRAAAPLSGSVEHQVALIRHLFGGTADLQVRRLTCGPGAWRVVCLHLAGLADRQALDDGIVQPLLHGTWPEPVPPAPDLPWVASRILGAGDVESVAQVREATAGLLTGKALLLAAGEGALLVAVQGPKSRSMREPEIESLIRGPREGFVELLATSMALLRRTLPTPNLHFEVLKIGQAARQEVALAYLRGRASRELVAEVRRRLKRIKMAAVLESRQLEEHLAEARWSPFPLLDNTERPDRVAAGLLEGRVAVLTSGTPFVLLAPTTLWHLLQTPADYYSSPLFANFARFMRTLGLLAALTLPATYVALTTYQHELLPTILAVTLASGRQQVPFPAVVEATLLELVFEAIREAGLRLPRPAGQAIGIVGALLLGEAGIRAGLVSPMMVIIVAVTGMASFTIPNYALGEAIRPMRFAVLVAASVLGFLGVMMAVLLLLYHLAALQSFGVPYLSPLAPVPRDGAGDALVRFPWPSLPVGTIRPRRGVRAPGVGRGT